ncbi:hypothetical protein MLD38_020938 [Melastoma candidum]|uniref:Uncharacterized protein n=1 Tax=Melastoma candidum TaxID=119954 RepID=A0ACB9QDU4_9MYRT|nr:hypothetical protein MLD38_020938 [Melastoma candidum]
MAWWWLAFIDEGNSLVLINPWGLSEPSLFALHLGFALTRIQPLLIAWPLQFFVPTSVTMAFVEFGRCYWTFMDWISLMLCSTSDSCSRLIYGEVSLDVKEGCD